MGSKVRLVLGTIIAIVVLTACWRWLPDARAQQLGPRGIRGSVDPGLDDPTQQQMKRLREGVNLVDQTGTFITMGDRIAFRPEGEEAAFGVLENLALERVWKVFDDTRERHWRVSGAVTEYRGRNYLLLTRAVLRANVQSDVAHPNPDPSS